MKIGLIKLLALCLLLPTVAIAEEAIVVEEPLPFFLLAGQSNMAGRTAFEEGDYEPVQGAYLLNGHGQWEILQNLRSNYNENGKNVAGVNRYSTVKKDTQNQLLSPGFHFAKALTKAQPSMSFGIVSQARGATSVKDWLKDAPPPQDSDFTENLYSMTLGQTNLAISQGGRLKGVLWLLGESDAIHFGQNYPNTVPDMDAYLRDLAQFIEDFRASVGDPQLPFFVSQITYVTEYPEPGVYNYQGTLTFNRRIFELADLVDDVYFPRTEGLISQYSENAANDHCPSDCVHFDHASMELEGLHFGQLVNSAVFGLPIFNPEHGCFSSQNSVCSTYSTIMSASGANDRILVANKGYWALDKDQGPAENSASALREASDAEENIAGVQFDLVMSQDNIPFIFHDLNLDRLTPISGQVKDYSAEKLTALPLRKRNGEFGDETMMLLTEGLSIMEQEGLFGIVPLTEAYTEGFVPTDTFTTATITNDAQFLVLKTTSTVGETIEHLNDAPWRYLYVPEIVVSDFDNDVQAIASHIDQWQSHATNSILYFELNIEDPGSPALQPFTRYDVEFSDIYSYISYVTPLRSGVFSIEPDGRRGAAQRSGTMLMPDTQNDMRGDPLQILAGDSQGHLDSMVVVTSRPDVWAALP